MVTILTLVIGADYITALNTCLQSKKDYATKHGYTYIQGGEAYWDRRRPISWSKVKFLESVLSKLPEGALVWMSDADVLITNPDLRLEDHLVVHLPESKDMMMTLDSCGHINAGNILYRNTQWTRDFLKRTYALSQFTYHPWWENAAMLALYTENASDRAKIEVLLQATVFNSYLQGIPGEPLWEPGQFLVHFAGVYDHVKMEEYARKCLAGEVVRIQLQPREIEACQASKDENMRLINL